QIHDALREAGFARYIAERGAAHALAGYAFHGCVDQLPAALLSPRRSLGVLGGGYHALIMP
ncbi:MAG: hypothetical protein WBM61_13645, partial [Woeseiaceae bacterium]